MSKIKEAFKNGKAFIPFVTCAKVSLAESCKVTFQLTQEFGV